MKTTKKIISLSIVSAFLLSSLSLGIPPASAKGVDPEEKVYYYLHDHLGGVDAVLDEEGNVVERRDYLPYGSERLTGGSTDGSTGSPASEDYGFTGKELDEETGLYYYGVRYYDPIIGRFASLDPLILGESEKSLNSILADPQALNGYSYVLNNPLRYVDEEGEYQKDVHYDLTYYLGLISGLGHSDSKKIAYHNQNTDVNMLTRPENLAATKKYHFQTREVALDGLSAALENESLKEFGTAFHTFQDTYSHADLTPQEHLMLNKEGKNPDYTYSTSANTAKANRMARSSFFQLRKLNLKINGSGNLTKNEYLQQSTEIWQRHKGEISSYLKLENKEGTKIEVLAQIAEKSKDDKKED